MNRVPVRDITPPLHHSALPAARKPLQPRRVEGRHARLRTGIGAVLTVIFFALPWLRWGEQPLLWVNVPAARVQLAGATYWPQDLGLLALALLVAAFGLFWLTVLAGRVWCGYACPQTLWAALFRACERITEGARPRQGHAPMTLPRLLRRAAKHGLWGALSLLTAFSLVALLIPAHTLLPALLHGTLSVAAWGWLIGLSLATYANAGWVREQVCIYACPYARFQAVMFDPATPVVTYHSARGEPRGRQQAGNAGAPQGACVDCHLCVQVCPTGIDIRQGLQSACIACGACVDACDRVMAKLYLTRTPPGLIAYGDRAASTPSRNVKRRPRLLAYGVLAPACALLLSHELATRPLVAMTVAKDRQLFRDRGDGLIENVYTFTLMNKDQQPHRYTLPAPSLPSLRWQGATSVYLAPGEQRTEVVRLALPTAQAVNQPIAFEVLTEGGGQALTVPSRFTGPRP